LPVCHIELTVKVARIDQRTLEINVTSQERPFHFIQHSSRTQKKAETPMRAMLASTQHRMIVHGERLALKDFGPGELSGKSNVDCLHEERGFVCS